MPTWSNASFPNNSGAISLLLLATAFETPFPIQRFLSPSRSSIASFSPVEAPDGTAARPRAPLSSVTSASIVGFPRESRICRPLISRIALMLPPQAAEKSTTPPAQPQQLFHPPALSLPRQPLRPGTRPFPIFVLCSTKFSTGTRPPHQLGGAHKLGAPCASPRAPRRVRLRFFLTCRLVGRLFEPPVRPQSNPCPVIPASSSITH